MQVSSQMDSAFFSAVVRSRRSLCRVTNLDAFDNAFGCVGRHFELQRLALLSRFDLIPNVSNFFSVGANELSLDDASNLLINFHIQLILRIWLQ